MQVYVALYYLRTNTPYFLIVKKREFNNWWKLKGDAKQGGPRHLVNQAGQWSFPGGKAEKGDWTGEAMKEFTEETGLEFPNVIYRQIYSKGDLYRLFVFEVTDDLDSITAAIKAGVAPNPHTRWPQRTFRSKTGSCRMPP